MLDLLRKNFFFSLHRAAMVVPTKFRVDPIDMTYTIIQENGFRVKFKEEEVQRWVM